MNLFSIFTKTANSNIIGAAQITINAIGRKMEKAVVELLKPVTLNKENCAPLLFETGTVLKVIMRTPKGLLVSHDNDFNFMIALKDQNELWREI